MNILDIILLVPLLLGAFLGFKRGLIMELVGFAALILAILGAFRLLHNGTDLLSRYFPDLGNFIPVLAFIIIFIGIIILVNILGGIVKRMLHLTFLGTFDHVAGAILGIFKWAFLVSVGLWLLDLLHVHIPEDQMETSYLYPYLVNFAPRIGNYVAAVFPFADNLFDSIRDILK